MTHKGTWMSGVGIDQDAIVETEREPVTRAVHKRRFNLVPPRPETPRLHASPNQSGRKSDDDY